MEDIDIFLGLTKLVSELMIRGVPWRDGWTKDPSYMQIQIITSPKLGGIVFNA